MNRAKTSPLRVLGIDPGYDRMGMAVIEGDPSRPTHVWSDCIIPPKGTAESRLAVIYAAVHEAITIHAPVCVGIETLFFAANKTTAIGVAEARGAILAAAGTLGCPVVEFAPSQVKLAVTGHGAADKAAIARMIPHLISLPPKKRLDDELDAIAVALAALTSPARIS